MFAIQPVCTETVSVLTALLRGADGACVDLGGTSLIVALIAFIAVTVLLQRLANRLLFGASKRAETSAQTPQLRSGQVSAHVRRELR